ncbi:MAG: hypothetical protein IPO92_24335 [Saprospiraceae bacterium]|nr:hypothetical protein [Saprospiraceae bacterium]
MAINRYKKAEKEYLGSNDSTRTSRLYNGLCVTHIQIREYKLAKFYGSHAVRLGTDSLGRFFANENLGKAYIYSGEGDTGRKYIDIANQIIPYTNGEYELNISRSYRHEGDIYCALLYADSSLTKSLKVKSDKLMLVYAYIGELQLILWVRLIKRFITLIKPTN